MNPKSQKISAAVLMGPPGSGKTTVARSLAEDKTISVIETGNLLSAEVKRDSPLGREIMPYQAAGDLVPSELVKRVISAELDNSQARSVLFDGFPRNAPQVKSLFELLDERNLTLSAVFVLNVQLDTVIRRLSGRRLCQKCGALYNIHANPPRRAGHCDKCGAELIQRKDDKPEVIRRRFENYEHETVPVIELFRKEHNKVCLEVSAEASPEEVLNQMRP
jgi:adenylate kinase